MSYGPKGPPKGYSNPRGAVTGVAMSCQKCNSTSHWTYECKAEAGAGYTSRPSRTQLLRRGIKPQPMAVETSKTAREEFETELKERAAMLEAELRTEAGLVVKDEDAEDNAAVKSEGGQLANEQPIVKRERPEEDDKVVVTESPKMKAHRTEASTEQNTLDRL
jgi:hypothetical protein